MKPYLAKVNEDEGVRSCHIVGTKEIIGYKQINEYFMDASGFGAEDESALAFNAFIKKVRAGYYYGITRRGQFQVYVGEYVKTNRKSQLAELGIVSSKKVKNNTRLTTYTDGRRVLTLHQTDIITWTPDSKIILNTGGWHTTTTKSRMNEFLPGYIRVYQKNYKWYIRYNRDNDDQTTQDLELTDGIELSNC